MPRIPSSGLAFAQRLRGRAASATSALKTPWLLALGAALGGIFAFLVHGPFVSSPFGPTLALIFLASTLVVGFRLQPRFSVIDPTLPELLAMIELKGGPFEMGSDDSDPEAGPDEQPLHSVTLSPFAMSQCVVTRRLYREVLPHDDRWKRTEGEPDDGDLPANEVSWSDAVKFCNELSIRTGLDPCYTKFLGKWTCHPRASGYRLPTEAEFEYAARADAKPRARYWWGDDADVAAQHAWFDKNSGNRVQPVDPAESSRTNGFGLHGMAGNVWQWCEDWYDAEWYAKSPRIDPRGSRRGNFRVLRGGSAWDGVGSLRSAGRGWVPPENRNVSIGFRCVRASRRQP